MADEVRLDGTYCDSLEPFGSLSRSYFRMYTVHCTQNLSAASALPLPARCAFHDVLHDKCIPSDFRRISIQWPKIVHFTGFPSLDRLPMRAPGVRSLAKLPDNPQT